MKISIFSKRYIIQRWIPFVFFITLFTIATRIEFFYSYRIPFAILIAGACFTASAIISHFLGKSGKKHKADK